MVVKVVFTRKKLYRDFRRTFAVFPRHGVSHFGKPFRVERFAVNENSTFTIFPTLRLYFKGVTD